MKSIFKYFYIFVFLCAVAFSGNGYAGNTFSNSYCQFEVPESLEIQDGFYKELTDQVNDSDDVIFKMTLQQKGLNNAFEETLANGSSDAFNEYCRIMVTCSVLTAGEVEELSESDLALLDEMMYELFSAIYKISKWVGVYATTFAGYDAYVTEYVRESTTKGGGDVHVYNIVFYAAGCDWNIVFSAREKDLAKWSGAFDGFERTFQVTVKSSEIPSPSLMRSELYSWPISNTAKSITWYNAPSWTSSVIQRIKVSSFNDSHLENGRIIMISVNVLDYGSSLSKRKKNSLLRDLRSETKRGVEQEYTKMGLTTINDTVDENSCTYTYRYSLRPQQGVELEVFNYARFEGSKLITYDLCYSSNHPDKNLIVDSIIN